MASLQNNARLKPVHNTKKVADPCYLSTCDNDNNTADYSMHSWKQLNVMQKAWNKFSVKGLFRTYENYNQTFWLACHIIQFNQLSLNWQTNF